MTDNIKWFNEIIIDFLKSYNIFSENKYVYHYTNLSSLMNILESNELWLSERSCMNDKNEENFVKKFCKTLTTNSNNNPWKFIETTHQYLFSTSKEKDSIHQWSYYGSGDGVCIEFEREKLINLFGELFHWAGYYYGSVIYTKEWKYNSIGKTIIIDIYNKYKDILNNESEQKFQYEIVSEYLYTLIKQYGHHCEEEYRFVITEDSINFKINELKSENNDILIKSLTPSFRPMKSLIVPYIRIPFNPKNLISSIMIGPNNHEDIAVKNLKFYLHAKELDSITVTKSLMNIR